MNWKITIIHLVCIVSMQFGAEICKSSELESKRDFLFVRHGQTDWGAQDILKGPLDLHLNKEGRKQAQFAYEASKDRVPIVTPVVFSSSLVRAYETAEIFCENLSPRPPIQTVEDLKERYYGDYSKIHSTSLTLPEDAESTEVFQRRIYTAITSILKEAPVVDSLIIVSHQKVFECLTEWLIHKKLSLSQGGVCYFQFNNDMYTAKVIQ